MKHLMLRELRLATRARQGFGLPLAYYLAVAVLIPFGVGPDARTHGLIAVGILWAGALLATLISLQQVFEDDREDGTVERLALAPVPLEGFVFAKIAANWTATALPICLSSPLVGIVLNLPQGTGWAVLVTLLLGTPALSAIGVLGASFAVGSGRGGLLASVIVVPFCIPTLIFGSASATGLAEGTGSGSALAALSAITLACVAVIPVASAKVLRISLA